MGYKVTQNNGYRVCVGPFFYPKAVTSFLMTVTAAPKTASSALMTIAVKKQVDLLCPAQYFH